jgi:invasion protein IalB
MKDWITSASPWPGPRTWGIGLVITVVAVGAGLSVLAQTPPPVQPAPPAPKALPKAAPAAPKAAPQQQAPAPGAAAKPAGGVEIPPLNYSPWTKVCMKVQEGNAQQVCYTGKEGRLDTGMMVIGAVLIEPEGSPTKILRVTLPLGMLLPQGTRAIVDQGQPMTAPYLICAPNGCMADYEASNELIDKLKKGQSLVVQGMNNQGQAVSLPLPLPEFAKAHDGPPTDPKALEERQKKEQEAFQKKQQLQQQQQQQQQAPAK